MFIWLGSKFHLQKQNLRKKKMFSFNLHHDSRNKMKNKKQTKKTPNKTGNMYNNSQLV